MNPEEPASTVEDTVFLKLVRVVNLTARPFQQRVGRLHQLTLNEWRTMALLGARPGLTATRLTDLTGLDKMAVSRALAGLQRAGRLHRHEDPTDQRRSRLYLSSAGELQQLNATLDKLIASVAGVSTRDAGAASPVQTGP